MRKETFVAVLEEEGLTKFEATGLWTAEQRLRKRGHGITDVETLREFVREVLPNFLRLRALQKARGAAHRQDL